MDDLISRSALLDDIRKTIDASGCVNHEGEMLDCIRYASAVDAVIPVRCKGCEYVYEYQPAGCGRVALFCENENAPWYTTEHAIFVEENGYCSYGDRRGLTSE